MAIWARATFVCALLCGVALGASLHGRERLDVARFEASIPRFLTAFAEAWAENVKQRGRLDDNGDLAQLLKDALRKAPLAMDLKLLSRMDDCDDCKAEVKRVQTIFKSQAVKDILADLAKQFCKRLELFADHICDGAVNLWTDLVIEIVAHSVLEPLEVCGNRGVCVVAEAPTWNVTFPKPKPAVRPVPTPTPQTPRRYILQLTDVHYDPSYTPGLEAVCGEPLCCRPPNGPAVTRAAGIFGDYNCDSPRRLIQDALDFLSTSTTVPEIAAIFWTGDIPPHDVWESTKEGYTALMADQAKLIAQYFPGVPVYAAIGNHESVPVDEFAPASITEPEFSTQWLYDVLASQWSPWLPADAQAQVRRGGSYTTLLQPGLRIVSVNDEGCSTNNWWLRMRKEGGCCKQEYSDPDNILHWLVEVLQAAEDNNERVFLLRHVMNSSRCNVAWSNNFYQIVVRYENTIISIHSGHSHDDYFGLYYRDDERTQATTVCYISPAITPYTNGNPAARIYEVAWDSFDIVNTYTYLSNLTLANEQGRMTWFTEYNAQEGFRMRTTSAQEWHDLTVRFEQDQDLFDRYYGIKMRQQLNGRTCTGACRTAEICNLRSSRTSDTCLSAPPTRGNMPEAHKDVHECWRK